MLKVGVIGCGGMGKDHIRRLTNKIQGAEVVAVSDVFEESAKQAAAICRAKVYTDANELINDDVFSVLILDTESGCAFDVIIDENISNQQPYQMQQQ